LHTRGRWDPIFEAESFGQTYAEMDKELKNSISHRYRWVPGSCRSLARVLRRGT
jgi:inosine/xanthosine triphosphate pyrophosphatase family protein